MEPIRTFARRIADENHRDIGIFSHRDSFRDAPVWLSQTEMETDTHGGTLSGLRRKWRTFARRPFHA